MVDKSTKNVDNLAIFDHLSTMRMLFCCNATAFCIKRNIFIFNGDNTFNLFAKS